MVLSEYMSVRTLAEAGMALTGNLWLAAGALTVSFMHIRRVDSRRGGVLITATHPTDRRHHAHARDPRTVWVHRSCAIRGIDEKVTVLALLRNRGRGMRRRSSSSIPSY